ncbi:hypothetical protein [Mitsuaria sp. GD03876]|uniref:hypothetical protein n=1 Tax=Mitsuaria sp. GD03876 TaxID=2975399 RepID=UPI00244B82B3|nr:hypothetical protein [Mitsuaria sp. GD03876]MDH0864552.1 hypothetical protein [Mitsuaria sp. GD03876]
MKWIKWLQVLLAVSTAVYIFVPTLFDIFPAGFIVVVVCLIVTGPISARASLKAMKRTPAPPPSSPASPALAAPGDSDVPHAAPASSARPDRADA